MPSYQVIEKGFIDGRLYSPDSIDPVYRTDVPLKDVPPWLKPIKETAEQAEAATGNQRKRQKEAGEAAKAKQQEAKAVSFIDADNAKSAVVTL